MRISGPLRLGALLAISTPSVALAQVPLTLSPAAGDTAWILTATALVLFMTLPGLALFYAGLVRSKNVLSVMAHCVMIACLASIIWLLCGYSLSFSGSGALIGNLDKAALVSVTRATLAGRIPETVFFAFQMAFAIITPALIVGAFVERIKFSAVILFSCLWLVVVYAPVCHWVWGGGWLMQLQVMDYAGGLVVHATAGVSALVIAWRLGPRDGFPHHISPPHNPGMTVMGAGMLWVGWYGFNAGSALAANGDAGAALLSTHMSAAAAGLAWAFIEWRRFGRASMIGLVTGVVAGLATVTPASGYIGPCGGVVIGALGSVVCFHAVEFVRHRLKIDDSLDVFGVHGVGGILGTLILPVLALPGLGGSGFAPGVDAVHQFGIQALGVAAVCLWSGFGTLVIVAGVRRVVGLRVSDDEIKEGLDLGSHGEQAYRLT